MRGKRAKESGRSLRAVLLPVALLTIATLCATLAEGQRRHNRKAAPNARDEAAERLAKTKEEVATAAQAYKESLEKLLALQDADVKAAAANVDKRKALLDQQIVSKKEVEDSERVLASAQAKVAETRRQMGEADNLIAEVTAEAKLALMPAPRIGTSYTTAALIRYNGPGRWALTDAVKVEGFFTGQFHHSLPISAYGQTAVHTQLGFDHSNSIDVALHPDSAEGQALMNYLRSQGIPFIAFRQAVPGSATGAHIHIGYPSHRIK